MSILIVDDSKAFRTHIKKLLKGHGYESLIFASTPGEAFRILGMDDKDTTYKDVDLILLDKTLPDVDGIDVCSQVKASPTLKDIPIIMVTATTDVTSLQEAFEAGAMDYITKPLNEVEMLARVRSALKLKEEMDSRKAHAVELLKLSNELRDANVKLRYLSSVDGLTGLANRRSFDDYLGRMWGLAVRERRDLSLIIIDIDFFKPYNDMKGHLAGDDCLRQVAASIKGTVKRPSDLVSRYGGEEFTVILPETDMDGAFKEAENIRKKVIELGVPHGSSSVNSVITVSLGVACMTPPLDSSPEEIIEKADEALYKAKEGGRNRVEPS